MTPRARWYKQNLPPYNTALGTAETLVVTPPFTFQGVTARVFPLRARMNSLRRFCRLYLNVARAVCQFQPYIPYVFLVVLDYGRMAIDELNAGWISQHEIFFGVPLTMWRRTSRGRLVFDKFVLNTPFIVVDDARSLTGGRESYGWPKVLGELQTSPERWLIDPRKPTLFLSLDVTRADGESVRLLDIEQRTGQNAALLPPDPEWMDPFGSSSRRARTALTFGYDLARGALAAPFLGLASWAGSVESMGLSDICTTFLRPLLGADTVNLKQFRDAEDPTLSCYQALVESQLKLDRFNRGGFLGRYEILQGDITGGFRIRLHDNPAFPILESLGLEVVEERMIPSPRVRRQTVSFLEPVFPCWLSLDLTYDKGKTICWRTRDEGWHVGSDKVDHPGQKAHYNTIAGGEEHAWYGPYQIPEGSFDVYPLKADGQALDRFLDKYLDVKRTRIQFERHGEHVFMVASSVRIFSKSRSAAWLESRQLVFYLPVQWKRPHESQWKDALVVPLAFVENPILATSLREVQGGPTMNATIEALSRFLRRQEPLLRVLVDVFTALGAGLPSERRALIEVQPLAQGIPPPPDPKHVARVFPEGLLDRLMLKQFRDAEDPNRACYQSLVRERWTVKHDPKLKPTGLHHNIEARIYRYPSLPLVDILGLETTGKPLLPASPDGAVADVLRPDRPFRIDLSAEIGLGREIGRTAESLPWVNLLAPTVGTPYSTRLRNRECAVGRRPEA